MQNPSKQFTKICLIFLTLALLVLASLASCSGTKTLEGADRDAVLAYSEPMTDNLFSGFNSGDYATFSKNFNNTLKKSVDKANFAQLTGASVKGKIGDYISREVQSVQQSGGLVIVVYDAKFEKEDGVTVRVVMENGEKHLLSGIWFDSPKLREK